MAVQLEHGTGNGINRTTDIAPASGDYSCTFWIKPVAAPSGAGSVVFLSVNGVATYTSYVQIASTGASLTYRLEVAVSASAVTTATATIQAGMWAPFGYTRSGTTQSFYCNGVLIGTATKDVSAVTFTETWIGNDTGNDTYTGSTQYVREWTEALTLAELIDEWNSPTPVRTADLFTDTPLVNDYLDDSGNGHTWVPQGTPVPSFVTGAVPVPLTNTAATSAFDLGTVVPVDAVQVTKNSAGTVQTVWFSYTAQAADVVMGSWGMGAVSGYHPVGGIYVGSAVAPVPTGISGTSIPLQWPVTPGQPYFLRFLKLSDTGPAVLNVSLLRAADTAVAAGNIAINDSSDGFPLVIMDDATGDVIATRFPFPAGECNKVLTTGEVLVADDFGVNGPILYSADLTTTITPTMPATGYTIFGTDQATGWWCAKNATGGGNAHAVFVDLDGVVGSPIDLTVTGSIKAITPNIANTKLYFVQNTSNVNQPVKGFTIAGSVLANFIAGDAAYILRPGITTLTDDTLLVGYSKSSDQTGEIRSFDPGGSLVDTFTLSAGDHIEQLFTAIDDPDSFWVWYQPDNQFSRFRNIKISDGSTIADIESTKFNSGIYQGAITLTPSARFGTDFSCDPWVMRESIEPPPPEPTTAPPYHELRMGEPTYLDADGHPHLNPLQEPRLRRSPHVNSDHKRIFAKLFELDLQPGMGLPTGQGVDPIVMLRVSRDGGQTWSQERQMHVGSIGQYTKRCRALQLGSGRDLVFEVRVSDPVRWQIAAAYGEFEEGTN